jgi:outer membrane protein assembly factor BamB
MSYHPFPRFSPTRCRVDRVRLEPPLHRLDAWAMTGVTSMPLLAGGRVFLSLHEGAIAAFDEATAEPLWRHRSPGPHFPFGDGGCVLVEGAPLLYHQKSLTQLEPADGHPRVTVPVPSLGTAGMLPDGRRLFAGFSVGSESSFGAFDIDTGALLWKQPCPGASAGRPALGAGIVCYRAARDSICAVGASAGDLRWSVSVAELGRHTDVLREDHAGVPGASLMIVGDQLIVPVFAHHILSLNLATGEQRWVRRLDSVDPTSLACSPDGRLYVIAHGRCHVLDASCGEEVARFEIKADLQRVGAGPYYTDPDVSEGHLYAGSNRTLLAIDRECGAVDWSFTCRHEIPLGNAPVIAGGRMYTVDYRRGAHSGDLYAFAPETRAS